MKQSVYHIHNESDVLHMKFIIKTNFPKSDNNIIFRGLYHIWCDPDLGIGKFAMRRILCAYIPIWQSLQQLWQENVDAYKKPLYSGHVGDCKYASILVAYNKWYIVVLVICDLALNETDVEYIEEVQEIILDVIAFFSWKDSYDKQWWFTDQWCGNIWLLYCAMDINLIRLSITICMLLIQPTTKYSWRNICVQG